MKKSITFGLIIIVSMLLIKPVAAQQRMRPDRRSDRVQERMRPERGRRFMPQRRGGLLMILQARQGELNITDEQLEKIKKLTLAHEENAVKLRNSLNELKLKQRQLMLEQEARDYVQLRALLSQISDINHDLLIDRLKTQDAIFNDILTPEQKSALKKLGGRRPGSRGFVQGPRNQRGFLRFQNRIKR